jgi:hypothetical protein
MTDTTTVVGFVRSLQVAAAMSDASRPPSLPSTADEVAYAPVSWLAVGSVLVAGLFVLLLLIFGFDAFRSKTSLIKPELMILAGIAIVLSFAARRMIRTSEGTRTGESLTNVAWWMAVIGGIVYGAYWMAIEYAIRRDAREEVQKWINTVLKGELPPAFHRTLEPGRRGAINPADEVRMQNEFRDAYLVFRQSDLVRYAQRNGGDAEFVPGGLRDWVTKPKITECTFTGVLKTPEGSYPVHIPLKGVEGGQEGGGVRQWQVVPAQNGFVQVERVRLTKFGWLNSLLESQGANFAKQFVGLSSAGLGAQPYAYQIYANPKGGSDTWGQILNTSIPRSWVMGGAHVAIPYTADYSAYIAGPLFTLPNGAEPSASQRATFLNAWNTTGVLPSGQRLKNSPDTQNQLTLVRDEQKKYIRIEVRIPVEIGMPTVDSDMGAARGRVMVECTDPEALNLLNEVRANGANPDAPPIAPPEEFRKLAFKWRAVRVESDLKIVPIERGMGSGPGGAPMPGH